MTDTQPAELVSLMHKSLLQHVGPDRYALHALVRQFAAEKLEMLPDPLVVSDRHSAHYMAFVHQLAAALGGDEPQQAMAEVQAELANVRQAWQWAINRIDPETGPGPWLDALTQGAMGLIQFYKLEGLMLEGEEAFRTAVDRVQLLVQEQEGQGVPGDDLAVCRQALAGLLATQGSLLAWKGDHSAAVAVLQEAHDAYERAATDLPNKDLAGRAMLLVDLGTSYNRLGDHDRATQHLQSGLSLARQADASGVEITALSTLAQAASEQGEYETAQQHSKQMLELARSRGDRTSMASALSVLSSIAWKWGDVEQADSCLGKV